MLEFKLWLESGKFEKINPNAEIEAYNMFFDINVNNLKYSNYYVNDDIGILKTPQKEIKVKVGITNGYYDNIIFIAKKDIQKLRFQNSNDIAEMLESLMHELEHILSKKRGSLTWGGETQRYLDICNKVNQNRGDWGKISDDDKKYYNQEPDEFDAITTGFYYKILFKFEEADSNGKNKIIRKLEDWISNKNDDLFNLPINNWRSNPYLMKKLRDKISNLIYEIKQSIKQPTDYDIKIANIQQRKQEILNRNKKNE